MNKQVSILKSFRNSAAKFYPYMDSPANKNRAACMSTEHLPQ